MLANQIRRRPSADLVKKKPVSSKWHAFIASWLGETFDAMDASLYFIAMVPAVSELLHTHSDTQVGQVGSYVLAFFMLGWFFGALIFGSLADRIGRRKTMMATILIYSIATGLCALSRNWLEFGICRFIVGAGIGGEICLGTVMVGEFWRGKGRIWAASMLESSFNVGLLLSAFFNAVLGPYGWRWLFVAGVLPALMTLYLRSKLTESESFEEVSRHRADLKGRKDLTDKQKSELEHPFKQLFATQTRRRTITTGLLGMSAIIGYWACVAWIPAWINQLTGNVAIAERSWATSIFSIGGLLGCFLTPSICGRIGRKSAMKIGFGGSLLAAILMFLTVKSFGLPLLVWCFALGILTNVQFAALQIYIPEVFASSMLASAAGITFGAGRIFSAVLAICGSQLIVFYGGSYALASATLSLVYVLGFVAAFAAEEGSGEVFGLGFEKVAERELATSAA
ncbi:MAG TPA: MFS transporter [Planktothrix sp.]|jgi:MFS family permease